MSCNMGSCERSAGMCLVGRSKTELRMTCLSASKCIRRMLTFSHFGGANLPPAWTHSRSMVAAPMASPILIASPDQPSLHLWNNHLDAKNYPLNNYHWLSFFNDEGSHGSRLPSFQFQQHLRTMTPACAMLSVGGGQVQQVGAVRGQQGVGPKVRAEAARGQNHGAKLLGPNWPCWKPEGSTSYGKKNKRCIHLYSFNVWNNLNMYWIVLICDDLMILWESK